MTTEPPRAHDPLDDPSTNLASNRTAMSFERTKMSTERTLMSVMRTALSLISFGFTIYQFLSKFAPDHPRAAQSARNFGISLIVLGIAMLAIGLYSQFMELAQLRKRRNSLHALGQLHSGQQFRPSPVGVIALLLLLVGLVAIFGMALHTGPFG